VPRRNPAVTAVSAFFPCYNDADAIGKMVHDVYTTLAELVDDFEVIVVDDGSADDSVAVLHALQSQYPLLSVVVHPENRGYGAALISGFAHATKQWVFYTDGDAQYDATEVAHLIAAATETTDVVQGVKIGRGDPLHRKVIGRIYHHVVRLMFNLHVHDTDCDFRLIRQTVLDRVQLSSTTGCICVEMMRKFERLDATFVEVPVHHYARPHGRSQFFRIPHIASSAVNLVQLWTRLVLRRKSV
jgi:glycosyltransferase involved in cell wall biosynthesis